MIKILLKIIIDLLKTAYDLINLAIRIIIKFIKIVFKMLWWLIKKISKTIKKNAEDRAKIKHLAYNEYNGEEIPYLKRQEQDKQYEKQSFFTKIKNKIMKK